MSLSTERIEWQSKQAEAAKAMQRIGREVAAMTPAPEEMPANFKEAEADFKAATARLDKLKALDLKIAEAQAAHEFVHEPAGPAIGRGGGDGAIPSRPSPDEPVFVTRARATRKIRNYLRKMAGPVDAAKHMAAYESYIYGGDTRFQLDHPDIPASARLNLLKGGPANALRTDVGELGGFLVPPDSRNELIADIAAQSVMFRLCRIVPTTTGEAAWPSMKSDTGAPRIHRSGFRGEWRAQNEANTTEQSQPKWGRVSIPVHRWEPDPISITAEMLEDSAVNLEPILNELAGEEVALDMDSMCLVNGTGSGEPLSIINDTTITVVTATAPASIDYNSVVDLVFGANGLPSQYRAGAAIVMNTATYAALLKLNDGVDRPLINVFTDPTAIYKYPIEFSEFLAVPASSAKVAIFGNFANYAIAERVGIRLQRFQTTPKSVEFYWRARYGGAPLRSAGFRILKCAA